MPNSDTTLRVADEGGVRSPPGGARDVATGPSPTRIARLRGRRLVPLLLTGIAVLAAAVMTWAMWQAYMASPWTRDATVRVYVVTLAPEVAGRIVELPVLENQFVHKGDLLMVIDPTDYAIAVSSAEAQVEQAKANMENDQLKAQRRQDLTTLSTSVEQKQAYTTAAIASAASYRSAVAQLGQVRVNLRRTRIVSPVNGWVTNLQAQLGDYAAVGTRDISVVNADSFWVDGYFEETSVQAIRDGDPARVRLMGSSTPLQGHVEGVSHAINVSNAQADSAGLAQVNPVFTWVRLAQRIPVRIHLDIVPPGVRLVAGQTATVQIDPARPTPARETGSGQATSAKLSNPN